MPDIVLLSLPFAAGIAAGGISPAPIPVASAAFGLALASLATAAVLKGRDAAAVCLLFFFLGALRSLSGNIFYVSQGVNLGSGALEKLSSLIRDIPFRHGDTTALLTALFTGRRDLLSRGLTGAFRDAGAAHILALSGLHLGVIYLIISKLLKFLGNSRTALALRSAAALALCFFYAFMTGASPSIIRALIFIALNEAARHFPGRRKSAAGIWCASLMIQLLIKPAVIASTGFQLSYLAMLGIILLFPKLREWYPAQGGSRYDIMRKAWNAMALTLSCQIFTAPLVWLRFHSFPKYFLLTNLIALPLTEMLIFGGSACIALSAMKICPRFLTEAVDILASLLAGALATIADM